MAGRGAEGAEICDTDPRGHEVEDGLCGHDDWAQEDRSFRSRDRATRPAEYSLFFCHATHPRVRVIRRNADEIGEGHGVCAPLLTVEPLPACAPGKAPDGIGVAGRQ